jgi:hypothetical protein
MCIDDRLEDNDSRTNIPNPISHDIPAGDYRDLMICPASESANDEDWYRMPIASETEIACRIDFDGQKADLDLALVDGSGAVVRRSAGVGSTEQVRQCVRTPGVFYCHVYSQMVPLAAGYSMHVERTVGACCVDDALEPNDDAAHATPTTASITTTYRRSGLAICSGNDDFFAVRLGAGQHIVVDVTFVQQSSDQDLDIHFYAPDGQTDLTPCPPCDVTNGQSAWGSEHFERTVTAAATYYVIVRGYNGSANQYSISIAIQ